MDRIDLSDKGFCMFGLRGSGKSTLCKHILSSTPNHIVYDPMGDYDGFRHYRPDDRESVSELSDLVKGVVIPQKPDLFIIDEANAYIQPKPTRLPPGIGDLMDYGRHWGMAVGYVARRPVQFHTDLVELSDYLFFFKLSGKNDYRYLEDLHEGLGDAVRALAPFHFVCLSGGNEVTVHSPVVL